MAVYKPRAILTHDTDVQASGMSIDTTGKWMLVGVEAHEVFSSFVSDFFPKLSIPLGYVEEEASIIIKGIQATANSVRCAPDVRRA